MAAPKRKNPETSDPPTRKKRKMKPTTLQSIVEMPLDILFEIFSLLHPYDLLCLARTSKPLRRILMCRSSINVWKMSMISIGFPADDPLFSIQGYRRASEPALINMLFHTTCNFCGKSKENKISWNILGRCCKDCSYEYFATPYVMREFKNIHIHPQFPQELWDTIPYTLNDVIGSVDFPVKQYEVSTTLRLSNEYSQFAPNEERAAWLERRKEEAKADGERIAKCQAWLESQTGGRSSAAKGKGRGRGKVRK
ncbi:hypothetical protein Moror_12440 [Moniliophthora roreri MCA 2997]|uniref:F-box domain-containing protein n=1 Tax=Moniliophthora roreri (strain MCA 2997) TaxID=1381753 RepID=V2X9H1_MONRO|nr:hypothetical protein Moror_12440 [Moniliophthora roreri MCA 2997]KAI3616215.1 hypothetical protein WG66_014018 [Moniliophthora roreri]